jgi:TolB protein
VGKAFVRILATALLALATGCASSGVDHTLPQERAHLSNMRQLTFGGTNAEAYWSYDDERLIVQITRPPEVECDQMFVLDVDSGDLTQITDAGRTTCGFWVPEGDRVLFGSTHGAGVECPPPADKSQGYAWAIYDSYEIYAADPDGGNLVNLSNTPGYDAEATISRQGRVVFTSARSGDLELWTMEPDGSDLHQVTDRLGYDGGAFFSNDGSKLVWRATRFDSDEERQTYKDLLAEGLVKPRKMELFIANADGSDLRQLTDNGGANFAPFFTPDDSHIVFASSLGSASGFGFDLWMMPVEGGEPERITYTDAAFESFPMFSWDGERIVFTSGRNAANPGDLNVFVADWTP